MHRAYACICLLRDCDNAVVFGVLPASFDDPAYDEDRVPACIVIERPVCTLQASDMSRRMQ